MESTTTLPVQIQSNIEKWSQNIFREPKKEIQTPVELEKFKKSRIYLDYMQFLFDLQKSVESKKISATPNNPKFDNLVAIIDELEQWVVDIPPLKQPMRFGNKAFQLWHQRLEKVMKHKYLRYLLHKLECR